MRYELTVNGAPEGVDRPALTPLATVLREDLGLTGTKVGCGDGHCGACAVLVDAEPTLACLLPLALAEGREVQTVEGLSPEGGGLSPLQGALLDAGAVQCGMCTPGVVVMLTALLAGERSTTTADVRGQLSGTICRCSCFGKIIDAVVESDTGRIAP